MMGGSALALDFRVCCTERVSCGGLCRSARLGFRIGSANVRDNALQKESRGRRISIGFRISGFGFRVPIVENQTGKKMGMKSVLNFMGGLDN